MRLTPKKIGKFSVDDEVLATAGWERLGQVLSKTGMLVLHAEHRLDRRAIEYVAICQMFDEISEGTPTPEYRLEYEHKGHVMSVHFTRVS